MWTKACIIWRKKITRFIVDSYIICFHEHVASESMWTSRQHGSWHIIITFTGTHAHTNILKFLMNIYVYLIWLKQGALTRWGESTTTLKPYLLFITHTGFRLEHNISLDNLVFTFKQIATIHNRKTINNWKWSCQNSNARCRHFKSLYYVYIIIYVWSICPTLWAKFPSHHFDYVNNFYDIELGHKLRDQSLIRNIKPGGTGRKVFITVCCMAYTKIKPLKCKVVETPHLSPI